eukprot:gene11625-13731_t
MENVLQAYLMADGLTVDGTYYKAPASKYAMQKWVRDHYGMQYKNPIEFAPTENLDKMVEDHYGACVFHWLLRQVDSGFKSLSLHNMPSSWIIMHTPEDRAVRYEELWLEMVNTYEALHEQLEDTEENRKAKDANIKEAVAAKLAKAWENAVPDVKLPYMHIALDSQARGQGSYGSVLLHCTLDKTERAVLKDFTDPALHRRLRYCAVELYMNTVAHFAAPTTVAPCLGYGAQICPDQSAFLIMKYGGETLADFLTSRGSGIPIQAMRQLVIDLFRGISDLHAAGIVHGDLKGNNVLVQENLTDVNVVRSSFIPAQPDWVSPVDSLTALKGKKVNRKLMPNLRYHIGFVCPGIPEGLHVLDLNTVRTICLLEALWQANTAHQGLPGDRPSKEVAMQFLIANDGHVRNHDRHQQRVLEEAFAGHSLVSVLRVEYIRDSFGAPHDFYAWFVVPAKRVWLYPVLSFRMRHHRGTVYAARHSDLSRGRTPKCGTRPGPLQHPGYLMLGIPTSLPNSGDAIPHRLSVLLLDAQNEHRLDFTNSRRQKIQHVLAAARQASIPINWTMWYRPWQTESSSDGFFDDGVGYLTSSEGVPREGAPPATDAFIDGLGPNSDAEQRNHAFLCGNMNAFDSDNISMHHESCYKNVRIAVSSQDPTPTAIVIMGAYVSQCVLHTTLAAVQLGYSVIIVEDACVSYSNLTNVEPENVTATIEGHMDLLHRCAVVLNCADFIQGITQGTKAYGHQPGVVPITRHVHFAPSHIPRTSAAETEPPQQNESDDISAATCMLPAEGAKPNAVK